MNTLKAVESHFLAKSASSFSQLLKLAKRQRSTISFSSSDESGSSSSSEGDKKKQELLVRIAMLQTQKVRLTDYLDERSEYLTKFAEDANAEFDEIGEKAMKDLEEASDRIMQKLEGKMQAFEESSDVNKEEIERNEKELEEFEDQIQKDRNEGLFFKNLGDKESQSETISKAEAKVEAQKVREIAKESAGSKLRRNIYLGLMSLLAITITEAVFTTNEVEWGKVTALLLILTGLFAQFYYEQSISNGKKGKK